MLITAPTHYHTQRSLFLAGGISNCPDWQSDMVERLKDSPLVLFNPRRPNFSTKDTEATQQQIYWEFLHLRKADAILFWFPMETDCPITLFELGAWSMAQKLIFVGTHPDYRRRVDVETQLSLVRPRSLLVYSLDDLAKQVATWVATS